MSNRYINSPYFWDYKIKKSALKKPEVKKFWLERKINFCDWKGIKKKDLQEYLPILDIRPDLKKILIMFLKHESK
ncbi:MAG: hypothetical protein ABIF17_01305 [Patescibacteria group bacterium]